MKNYRTVTTISMMLIVFGCASDPTEIVCVQPENIQNATETPRIVAPDGLSELRQDREMIIAKASPKDSRTSDSPCLEMPPRILNQIPTF